MKDPDYLARYARENYQYSKNGEIILKIDKKNKTTVEETNNEDFNHLLVIGISIFALIGIYIFIKSIK